jgi:hypothetical protein
MVGIADAEDRSSKFGGSSVCRLAQPQTTTAAAHIEGTGRSSGTVTLR